MKIHPLNLNKQELESLKFKSLKISIGPLNSDEVNKIIEGQIINYNISGNLPNNPAYIDFERSDENIQLLPTNIVFLNNKGVQILFNIFEVKLIELIEGT